MTKTIIFITGYSIPVFLAKTNFFWNDLMWDDYTRIYNSSKTPISDFMVEQELQRLEKLIDSFKYPIVASHSLGAWWTANLVMRQNVNIKKVVYWTPLTDINRYPRLFNASKDYYPCSKVLPDEMLGLDKHLVIGADKDLITPHHDALKLARYLKSTQYTLDGYHCYQRNHAEALNFMKNWLK